MGQLTIRNIDDTLLVQLKRKAWQEGVPLETFVRRLLRSGIETDEADGLAVPSSRMAFLVQADSAGCFRLHA